MSSTLLRLETVRVLRHESLDIGRAEPYLQRVSLVSISDQILLIAGTFTPHIKTLDAIHLATLLFVDPTATLITHDTTMARVAKELGMGVHDPLAQERPPIGVSGK
jgi:predicted nucleic acid-binding protein